jgi:hypothetical protein
MEKRGIGRKSKMNKQDTRKQNKFDNAQPDKGAGDALNGLSLTDQGNGFLIIPEGVGDDLGEKRCVQEHHNASHALWYLSMAVHALINGNPDQISREKAKRITGHLTYLREFLPDGAPDLRALVTDLLHSTEAENPETYSDWLRFVYAHWRGIRSLAERYGNHDKCFPMTAYVKITDLVNNRHWRKVWWWKVGMHKLHHGLKSVLKQVMKRGQKHEAQEKRNKKKD